MKPIEIPWKGGEHYFKLDIDHLRALEQKCDAGPNWVLNRLRDDSWRVDDIIQPIRLGLEGAGMSRKAAWALVQIHVVDEPIFTSRGDALKILAACLTGEYILDEDDEFIEVGKSGPLESEVSENSLEAKSTGHPSTGGPAFSGSTLEE